MEDKISVQLNGKEIEINIVDVYLNPDTGNELMVYTVDGFNDNEPLVSVFKKKDNGFELDYIEDESDKEFLSNLNE